MGLNDIDRAELDSLTDQLQSLGDELEDQLSTLENSASEIKSIVEQVAAVSGELETVDITVFGINSDDIAVSTNLDMAIDFYRQMIEEIGRVASDYQYRFDELEDEDDY